MIVQAIVVPPVSGSVAIAGRAAWEEVAQKAPNPAGTRKNTRTRVRRFRVVTELSFLVRWGRPDIALREPSSSAGGARQTPGTSSFSAFQVFILFNCASKADAAHRRGSAGSAGRDQA